MRLYTPPPACPVHGKAAVRLRNGTYGWPGETTRRQRYRCRPTTPDPNYPRGYHDVTPPLPREHVHCGGRGCGLCNAHRGVHHGERAVARRQSWNLRLVVEGLEKLATGLETYSSVGRRVWETTGRARTRPAKLSDAERERCRQLRDWQQRVRAAQKAGLPRPRKPRGALCRRDGNSDPAWDDLAAYRDALTARHAATQRQPTAKPHRVPHSAPATGPQRRRFTAYGGRASPPRGGGRLQPVAAG